jgi:hypothetical protein
MNPEFSPAYHYARPGSARDLAIRLGAWRFDPALAAAGSARVAAAAAVGQGVVMPAAERLALLTSIGLQVTLLRHALPRPSLPLIVVDGAAKRIADEQKGVLDPRSGKSAILFEPFGPVVGRSDARSRQVVLAGAHAVRVLQHAKETSAPAVDFGIPGGINFDPPLVIGGGGTGESIAPAVIAGIALGALVIGAVGFGVGWFTSDKRAEMDAKSTIEVHHADVAAALETKRMELEAASGKKIEPSPMAASAAAKIKEGAGIETSSRWTRLGIVLGVTAIGATAATYAWARR